MIYWSGRVLGRRVPERSGPIRRHLHAREPVSDAQLASVRLSVVMTVGDVSPADLRASFRSVFAQTHDSWELCVCEDGSGMALTDVLTEYRGSDPRLRILPAGCAVGPAQSTNLAAEQASGELLVLLQAGDELHPEALRQFADAVRRIPRPTFCTPTKTRYRGPAPMRSPCSSRTGRRPICTR